MRRPIKEFAYDMVLNLAFFPVYAVTGLLFAWIPMLGWNLGIQDIFPQLPEITYMQSFWATLTFGWLVMKPKMHVLECKK